MTLKYTKSIYITIIQSTSLLYRRKKSNQKKERSIYIYKRKKYIKKEKKYTYTSTSYNYNLINYLLINSYIID